MHASRAVLASVCTGSLLLAATGLLNGRSCAGHWSFVDRFRVDVPRVRFDPALILDLANEDDGLITAGGGTSWHDLALHLVARYCGPLAASQTAKIHLLASHEDGQLPFSSMTRRGPADDATIAKAETWIGEHYATPNPVSRMTDHRARAKDLRSALPSRHQLQTDRLRACHPHRTSSGAARARRRRSRRRRLHGRLPGPDLLPAPLPADDGPDASGISTALCVARGSEPTNARGLAELKVAALPGATGIRIVERSRARTSTAPCIRRFIGV